jgi:hypothetical protein
MSEAKRKIWQIHLSTAIVLVLAVGLLLYINAVYGFPYRAFLKNPSGIEWS